MEKIGLFSEEGEIMEPVFEHYSSPYGVVGWANVFR